MNISVCIPTYNRKEYLLRAIKSALHQIESGDEIVIQDNASTDGTQEYLSEILLTDSRLKYKRNDKNIGLVLNFGEVVKSANNDYIYLLTDDDYLIEGAIERVKSFFLTSKCIAFKTAFFLYQEVSKIGDFVSYFKNDKIPTELSPSDLATIYHSSHIFTGFCFKREIFDENILQKHKDNWYPSMLFMGIAGKQVGYLTEPTNIHTWENETYWDINPQQRKELTQGQINILKYLIKENFVDKEVYSEIVLKHISNYPFEDYQELFANLDEADLKRAKGSQRKRKSKLRWRKFKDKVKKHLKVK